MIEVVGAYNTAFCYTGELEEAAAGQIKAVCDQPAFADCKIRIMPDVHAGMGCTIGTTMTITDKIVPGMVWMKLFMVIWLGASSSSSNHKNRMSVSHIF